MHARIRSAVARFSSAHCTAWAAMFLLVTSIAGAAAPPTLPWLAHGDPGAPPPTATPGIPREFWFLLESYQALGVRLNVSFDTWMRMQGIKDPARRHWYDQIYRYLQYQGLS